MELRRFAAAVGLAACFVIIVPWTSLAQGSGSSMPWKHAGIGFGAYIPTFDTNLKVQSKTVGAGSSFDLEDVLGLDVTRSKFRVDAFWRFLPRHRIDLSFYDISRDGNRSLTETLQIGDNSFTVGINVTTETDIQIYQVSYAYSFWQDQDVDLAASLGFFVLDARFGISEPSIGSETVDLVAPLPVLGLKGAYAIEEDLFLRAGAQFFFIDNLAGDKLSGLLIDMNVGLEYDISEHVALGLGYSFDRIKVTFDDGDNRSDLEYNWGAVLLYLKLFN